MSQKRQQGFNQELFKHIDSMGQGSPVHGNVQLSLQPNVGHKQNQSLGNILSSKQKVKTEFDERYLTNLGDPVDSLRLASNGRQQFDPNNVKHFRKESTKATLAQLTSNPQSEKNIYIPKQQLLTKNNGNRILTNVSIEKISKSPLSISILNQPSHFKKLSSPTNLSLLQSRSGSQNQIQFQERKKVLNTTSDNEPIAYFNVIVHYEQQQYTYQIDLKQTTDWFEGYLIKEVKKLQFDYVSTGSSNNVTKKLSTDTSIPNEQTIVSFITVDRNLPTDFYLTQKNRPLSIFKDKTLNLTPYIYIEKEPRTNNKINLKDFIFLKCIGMGGFSRVYLVKKKSTGRFFAMKLIDKEFIMKNRKQGIVQNERDIMTFLNHPFIIGLECSFESKNFIIFVVEFCNGGELFLQLKQVKRMTEEQARFYFSEICLGMLYLHSLNVIYRDIKPENILIDMDGHVRIADFGLSKPNFGEEDFAYSFCGSPEYMAPEMLLKVGHNTQVDHYCLGALLYELVTGLPPFYSRDTEKIYDSILNEELTFPSRLQLTPEIIDLLKGMLIKQPKYRLGSNGGMLEILSHPWFKSMNLVDLLEKKIPPPFKIPPLQFSYESQDLSKGELETREKLLGRTGLQQDVKLFKIFYFDKNEQHQFRNEQLTAYQQHYNFVKQHQRIMNQATRPKQTNQNFVISESPKREIQNPTLKRLQNQQRKLQILNPLSRQTNQLSRGSLMKKTASQTNFYSLDKRAFFLASPKNDTSNQSITNQHLLFQGSVLLSQNQLLNKSKK